MDFKRLSNFEAGGNSDKKIHTATAMWINSR